MRWNEPFQKLATCDTDGGIFVWIQYEGRWSVELVNDRGAQVRAESHQEVRQQFKMHFLLFKMYFELTLSMPKKDKNQCI